MNTVWCYGGVIFKWYYGGSWQTMQDVDFYGSDSTHSVADAIITYKPEYVRANTAITREIREKFLGYRPEISIEFLNILPDDGESIKEFFIFLSNFYGNYNLGVQVNVDSAGDGGVFFPNIKLDSDISLKPLHKLEIGQTMKLKFIGSELSANISSITGDSAEFYIFDENDNYIVDENSNKIIGYE